MKNANLSKERQVINVGHSLGMTIPPEMLKALGITKGTKLVLTLLDDGLKVTKKKGSLSSEFITAMNETLVDYHDALETLKKSDE
ncbi:AbrB/MazE/SpoVT family DNA-binding domain-containing protein [Levilactobacillus tujiorum]|uniref:AbrB/MazE/SpoVT family DNA-binding domain-containing protein n=1 Tax=Levilactobacillus tujiorum TaxID=2912243 RepID=A0ABX1L7B3_9LACO|nr:AbrB/MazE/SpoVT family DNA-binding domain-containing protein [Levilactobacillus tujiorum]NLR12195.1 AbrB/MazE/SpoVT family DNA-binding domain-containing protein [Lactobacillus sp. HBUAS51387]NLR30158.1 AbrB/MazE/SpoVT family DNA-binding domain-containing protein [Levilactobacillus tujiorum]